MGYKTEIFHHILKMQLKCLMATYTQ